MSARQHASMVAVSAGCNPSSCMVLYALPQSCTSPHMHVEVAACLQGCCAATALAR